MLDCDLLGGAHGGGIILLIVCMGRAGDRGPSLLLFDLGNTEEGVERLGPSVFLRDDKYVVLEDVGMARGIW